jgi:putative transposase
MPRRPRHLEGNIVYHIYNRRVDKQRLFGDEDEYSGFVALVAEANDRYPVRLHSYCLMSTHWHFAASAESPESLSKYVGWIATRHAHRLRRDTQTVGHGHIYQDRFKSVPADGILNYVRLIRYIERNPVAGGAVARAEDWPWSSLRARGGRDNSIVQPGPWRLPVNWLDIVNTAEVCVEQLPELAGQVASFRPSPLSFH